MSEQMTCPKDVEEIINTLEQAGYEAYAVGGCVRDALLGRVPNDWDITTSATPEQTKQLFDRTIDTGIEHGTVTVMKNHVGYEVTTYRVDGVYLDGRHPSGVTFTRCLEEDLKRRDFTINAMAFHPKRGIVDLFDGQGDLKRGIIRCVGDAKERFSEDALRILRAVRFAAQLGFSIEESTIEGILALKENLNMISKERIAVELIKLLTSDHPDFFLKLYDYGLTAILMPEFDDCMKTKQHTKHHSFTVGLHIIHVLTHIRKDKVLRLAALLHDFGKPSCHTRDEKGLDHFYGHPKVSARMAKEILRGLKLDNDTIQRVCHLVEFHDYRFKDVDEREVRRAMNRIGEEYFEAVLELERADALGKHETIREETRRTLDDLQRVEEICHEIQRKGECVSLKTLAVNGNDLIMLGCPRGPKLGEILNSLLEQVLTDPEKNNAEVLKDLASDMLR